MFNIIGDIGGQYDALMRLLDKMPADSIPVSVGDLIDRGPDSNKVVEFFRLHGKAIKGNHEDMMIDFLVKGEKSEYNMTFRWPVWMGNGGRETLASYSDGKVKDNVEDVTIPASHLKWLMNLPSWIEEDGLIITHAPINPVFGFEKLKTIPLIEDHSLAWNRGTPKEIPGKVQIFGHEAGKSIRSWGPVEKPWAICIDTSRAKVLTGIHWPSMKTFQEEY